MNGRLPWKVPRQKTVAGMHVSNAVSVILKALHRTCSKQQQQNLS